MHENSRLMQRLVEYTLKIALRPSRLKALGIALPEGYAESGAAR